MTKPRRLRCPRPRPHRPMHRAPPLRLPMVPWILTRVSEIGRGGMDGSDPPGLEAKGRPGREGRRVLIRNPSTPTRTLYRSTQGLVVTGASTTTMARDVSGMWRSCCPGRLLAAPPLAIKIDSYRQLSMRSEELPWYEGFVVNSRPHDSST